MEFRELTIKDKDGFDACQKEKVYIGSESCFTDIFCWRFAYQYEIAFEEGFVFLRGFYKQDGVPVPFYMYPAGSGNFQAAIEKIMQDADQRGVPLRILAVDDFYRDTLEKTFPGMFVFYEDRDIFDYIYKVSDLAELKGKTYHGKKNHVNKFKKLYPEFAVEPISPENMAECIEMNKEWCKENGADPKDKPCGGSDEFCAVLQVFDHFDTLGCRGILIRVGGKVIAYTLGTPRNQDVFVTHFEKALYSYEGAFSVINQEFAKTLSGFEYINREEDMGLEGLRKAKMSYKPEILYRKYHAARK